MKSLTLTIINVLSEFCSLFLGNIEMTLFYYHHHPQLMPLCNTTQPIMYLLYPVIFFSIDVFLVGFANFPVRRDINPSGITDAADARDGQDRAARYRRRSRADRTQAAVGRTVRGQE